ncbi:hypothetical protein ACFLV5_05155 [Chloroflexota bacterium]
MKKIVAVALTVMMIVGIINSMALPTNVFNSKLGPVIAYASPNEPPYEPSNPSPTNHAISVPIDTLLDWTGGDPDNGDRFAYGSNETYSSLCLARRFLSLRNPLESNDLGL